METLEVGQTAEIEGPYGCFNFQDDAVQQIWFAAGIGIAPFLTAIEAIGTAKPIILFYSYREEDESFLNELQQRTQKIGVKLYMKKTSEEGRFTFSEIIERIESIEHSSVWFCGPSDLGKTLERKFIRAGLPVKSFHRELFEFR